jgi:hypothetical protein
LVIAIIGFGILPLPTAARVKTPGEFKKKTKPATSRRKRRSWLFLKQKRQATGKQESVALSFSGEKR